MDDDLTALIAQVRKLGFHPEAARSPLGWPSLYVPGMRMEMRHRLSHQFPNTITGGGQVLHLSNPGQYIEVEADEQAIEAALH